MNATNNINFLLMLALGGLWSSAQGSDQQLSKFERYEVSYENEQDLIEQLAEKFLQKQDRTLHEGRRLRGTHAKGTCADATFEIFESLPSKLRVGLFENPANLRAKVRFSNAAGEINHDNEPDVRSVSFAVYTQQGARQDFSMNNAPVFPIGSLSAFNFLLELAEVQATAYREAIASGKSTKQATLAGKASAALHLAKNPLKATEFLKIAQLGAKQKNKDVFSYRNQTYWSGSAFKYGEEQAAKFVLTPCYDDEITGSKTASKTDYDFLQNDLKTSVQSSKKPVCFVLNAQLLDDKLMKKHGVLRNRTLKPWQWVEDPTLDWEAAGAPIYPVGRLTLVSGTIYDSDRCDHPDNGFNVMENSLPEHRGLGRINRGRSRSEQASKENR